jgi:hypothetical protein
MEAMGVPMHVSQYKAAYYKDKRANHLSASLLSKISTKLHFSKIFLNIGFFRFAIKSRVRQTVDAFVCVCVHRKVQLR